MSELQDCLIRLTSFIIFLS